MQRKIHVQIQTISRRFRTSQSPGKRDDTGSSECIDNVPYNLQGRWLSNEGCEIDPVAKRGSAEVRSLAPLVGDSTKNLQHAEEGAGHESTSENGADRDRARVSSRSRFGT